MPSKKNGSLHRIWYDKPIIWAKEQNSRVKKECGERLKVQWISAPVRDQIVDFISFWKQHSGLWG